jgi:hypothetical protein
VTSTDSGKVDALHRTIKEVTSLVTTLGSDLKYADGELEDQRHRRALVRAVFAFVEGTAFGLKRIVLESHEVFRGKLAPNLRFIFGLGQKAFGRPVPIDFSHEGWAALKQSITVRNRLMHPKGVADLEVSHPELVAAANATAWFRACALTFMKEAGLAAQREQSRRASE